MGEPRFRLSPAEEKLRDEAAAIAAEMSDAGELSREDVLALCRRLEPLGYLSSVLRPGAPGPLGFAAICEGLSPDLPLLGNHSVQRYLTTFGSDAQKARFLPPLLEGRSIGAIAITESRAAADLRQIGARATRRGGDFVLDGEKTWVTHGLIADLFVVLARTEAGATRFLVPGDAPGLHRTRLETLGLRHLTFAEIRFERCAVPASFMLGRDGEGAEGAKTAFPIARALAALQALRIGERALSLAAGFARDRALFGRPLADSALVQDRLAEIESRLAGARLLAYATMARLDDAGVGARAASAKAMACQAALDAVGFAGDLLGSSGLREPWRLERLSRDARMMAVVDGTVALNRFVAARGMLKADRS